MDTLSNIVSLLLWLLVAYPICLWLHELGHASMILLLSNQNVTLQFGVQGTKRELHWGRVTILLYFEPSALFFGRYLFENYAVLSKNQVFWITIGGPLISLLLTVVGGVLWLPSNNIDPWRGLTLINLVCFLNSSIPRYYDNWQGVQAGIPNDGLQLLRLIQQAK